MKPKNFILPLTIIVLLIIVSLFADSNNKTDYSYTVTFTINLIEEDSLINEDNIKEFFEYYLEQSSELNNESPLLEYGPAELNIKNITVTK